MLGSLVNRRLWLRAVGAFLVVGCDSPPDDSAPRAIEQRLVGTWLREYDEDGLRIRRVLVLGSDGRFTETSRTIGVADDGAQHSHAGEWLFDGTNLKRRYTSVDGRRPSAPAMPFATFELRFASRNEFVGIDRVRGHEVTYQRVANGTLP